MTDSDARSGSSRGERAYASLLGLAVGDALGRPIDGDSAGAVRDRHGRVTEMLSGDGPAAGTTTAVTAAAVRSAKRLADRSDSAGSTCPDGSRPANRSGLLLATAVPSGCPTWAAGERVAAAAEAVERTLDDAQSATAVDAAEVEPAAALAVIVGELVDGESVENAVSTGMEVAVSRGAPVSLRETLSVVGDRGAIRIDPTGDLSALFETALHEAVVAGDAEEAIVSAVSRGGNASALGAVAGAVAGARFGASGDAVPARWLNELDAPTDLRALADALVERTTDDDTAAGDRDSAPG
ncbi:ADP-ribosylglycohydrolase family protein [Halobaculum gomorrense]|uniref:ADP-ribosyl-[dinitrogen reductase] hydrolase n=1 Tax=Halobaculum gomorrense TaxID=43928 RepID=A0A1M5R2P0_9EURY|nr:ADP-ribosylglycohydrolase family protein [Halobaculum gomorrense]SHH20408.1 ADP-ribosyl-[dinitrogen reductase] hydrolase [Halobaculum gomorrense]